MKKKIETLTEEQRARFPEFVDRWTRIGLCTDPADRPAAEAAIREMYERGGKKPPAKIVWCGSPLTAGVTRAIILDKKLVERIAAAARATGEKAIDPGALVGASVWDSVGASVWDSVGASVWDSVGDSVGASVRDSVWDSVWDSVGASVRDSVWDSVWASVRDSVGASVRDSVWDSVWASVRASVGASVWDSVGASVRDSVRASVRASVWDSVWDSVGASVYGQHEAGWLAFYDFFREVNGLTEQTDKLGGLFALARTAGWAIPHENICWVSERHSVLARDDRGRLHCVSGPACAFPDGWAIYAVNGVRVPSWVIETPEKITPKTIAEERNAEVKRVMIARFPGGMVGWLKDSNASVVNTDRWGTLYRADLGDGSEPVVTVLVDNKTAEPDGSIKQYALKVHPELRPMRRAAGGRIEYGAAQQPTALNAVASTFGLTGPQYAKHLHFES